MRKQKGEDGSYLDSGMVDETGSDLNLSSGVDSCDSARDLWLENSASVISPTDIIVLNDTNTSSIMDVLLIASSKTTSWNAKYSSFVQSVSESAKWKDENGNNSCDITSAVCSDYMTTTNRSFSRKGVENLDKTNPAPASKNDWIVTYNKKGTKSSAAIVGVTPGKMNSSAEYVK